MMQTSHNMQKAVVSFLALLLAAVPAAGCARATVADPEDGYATDYAMGALEYSLLVTKELSVAENELSTRMIMAKSILDGSYETGKEISNTEESIKKVQEAQNVLLTTMPATTYESDRQNALDLLEDALLAMSGYETALKLGDSASVEAYAAEMRACFVAISGEANAEYE